MYSDQDGTPFYIGKGSGNRYRIGEHGKGFLKNKILKVGIDNICIEFLHKGLTEEAAFFLEKYYINAIGRRDKGEGPLCNLTDGGEGPSGHRHTPEAIAKISQANMGNKKTLGCKLSIETRKKMSLAKRGNKYASGSKGQVGKIVSDKTREKLRQANLGKKWSLESREKRTGIVPWNKGKKLSEEIRIKMSLAKKQYWQIKKAVQ